MITSIADDSPSFTTRVIALIKSIPEGYVMTYGYIAALAGNPRSARQVVRVLHSSSKKYNLPWHRVINSKGQISFTDPNDIGEQKIRLLEEGVHVDSNNKIDLTKYLYNPDKDNSPLS